MEFIHVSHSLNQTYEVHKSVFVSIAKKALDKVELITITREPFVKISDLEENIEYSLFFRIKEEVRISQVIKKITKLIYKYTENVIGLEPDNIKITIDK